MHQYKYTHHSDKERQSQLEVSGSSAIIIRDLLSHPNYTAPYSVDQKSTEKLISAHSKIIGLRDTK